MDNVIILAARLLAGIPQEYSPQSYDLKPEVSESDVPLVKVMLIDPGQNILVMPENLGKASTTLVITAQSILRLYGGDLSISLADFPGLA